MSVDGLGDCLEAVHVTGKADEVGGDKTDDCEHGGAAMTDLRLAEPGKEEGVGIGKIERIVLEVLATEVNASNHVVPYSVGGDGSRADAGLGSRSKGCGGAEDGGEDGGRLHFSLYCLCSSGKKKSMEQRTERMEARDQAAREGNVRPL